MGINMNQAFPSKYLKASDLGDKDRTVTISHVEMEDVGDDHKPVVYFAKASKGLVLNKTNANTITHMYGPETDGWTGKQITLGATWVEFRGEQTLAVRVRPGVKQQAAPAPVPAAAFADDNGGDLDDEIPF